MKFFGVIVLLAVAGSCQARPDARSKRATINENLVSMLEGFQETMKTGNEESGIPILDPYNNTKIEFAIDDSSAKLDGSLTNLIVNGLSEFSIDTLTFTVIGVKFTFAFTFPSIELSSGYEIDGTVASLVPIYGEGDLNVKLTNLTISGTVALSVSGGYLFINSMTSAFGLEDFDFQATGILNDDNLSALVSAVVTDMVPQLLVDYQTVITDTVNTVATNAADAFLGTMTLAELLALIRG